MLLIQMSRTHNGNDYVKAIFAAIAAAAKNIAAADSAAQHLPSLSLFFAPLHLSVIALNLLSFRMQLPALLLQKCEIVKAALVSLVPAVFWTSRWHFPCLSPTTDNKWMPVSLIVADNLGNYCSNFSTCLIPCLP